MERRHRAALASLTASRAEAQAAQVTLPLTLTVLTTRAVLYTMAVQTTMAVIYTMAVLTTSAVLSYFLLWRFLLWLYFI